MSGGIDAFTPARRNASRSFSHRGSAARSRRPNEITGFNRGMANVSRLEDVAHDRAKSTEDVLGAENGCELVGCVHPVLQRDDRGARADHRPHLFRCFTNLPRLRRHEDHVDDAGAYRVIGRVGRGDRKVTLDRIDAQASCAERLKHFSAREEDYVLARLREPPSEVPANSADSNHRDSHGANYASGEAKDSRPGA